MPDDKPRQFDALADALKNGSFYLSPPAYPLGRQPFPSTGYPGIPTIGEIEAAKAAARPATWECARCKRIGPCDYQLDLTVCAGCGSADIHPPHAHPQMPSDPFSDTDSASIALADMYQSMIRAGIPEHSTEVILGQMLGAMFSGDKPQQ
jgi:hypothetical protein